MRQRSGGMVILVISIVAGLLAALLSVSFLKGVSKTTTVLVVTKEIQPFTPLSSDMFAFQQLPGASVPADAITDVGALNGRYARTLLLPGTVIRQGHLAAFAGGAGSLAAKLTEMSKGDMRAVAIPVDNATGVGGTVQPGDRVDVMATVRIERSNGPVTTMAKVVAAGVPVLFRTAAEGTSKATVVVQVTPQQALDIAYAQTSGTIYLATVPFDAKNAQAQDVTADSFANRSGGR